MRGLTTMPIRRRDSQQPRGYPQGAFQRPRGMRNVRRDRTPRRTASRWIQGGGEKMPSAPPLSPLSVDLLITTRVRELAAAEAKERRDRQIAAVAKLLRRTAEDSRRVHSRK